MLGDQYAAIKEALRVSLFDGNFQPFEAACRDVRSNHKRDIVTCLALARQVRVYVIENQVDQLPHEKLAQLTNVINNADYVTEKNLAQTIIQRAGAPWNVTVDRDALLLELVAHCSVLVRCSEVQGNKWMSPFIHLATRPQDMQRAFLPTMPDDNIMEVIQASEEVRRAGREGSNITTYKCPNGHFYQIRDCGIPNTRGRCHECGAHIGGANHTAARGNTFINVDNIRENTAAGHMLGAANTRPNNPIPERKMSSLNTTILRMLTHLSMHIGAMTSPAHVAALVKPAVRPEAVATFFFEHLQRDLQLLTSALNRSPDDACLFMHQLLSNISSFAQGKASFYCCCLCSMWIPNTKFFFQNAKSTTASRLPRFDFSGRSDSVTLF